MKGLFSFLLLLGSIFCLVASNFLFRYLQLRNPQTGIVINIEPYEGYKGKLIQVMYVEAPKPSRITVLTQDDKEIVVIGSGSGIEVSDTISYIRKESLLGSIHYQRWD